MVNSNKDFLKGKAMPEELALRACAKCGLVYLGGIQRCGKCDMPLMMIGTMQRASGSIAFYNPNECGSQK